MDYKEIEQLLESYWNGTTSLAEEEQLRSFFMGDTIPEHLLRYKDLFCYQVRQREVELGEEFDQKIYAAISNPVVRIKPMLDRRWFVPLLRATAIVLSVAFIGNVAQDIFSSANDDYDYESYNDTYDSADVAYEQVSSALLMVSEVIKVSQVEKMLPDSVDISAKPEELCE